MLSYHSPQDDTPLAKLVATPIAAEGGVAGTRKYSAHKAGGSLVLGAVAASAAAAPLLGIEPWSLVNIETAFALATASSLAGGCQLTQQC